MKPDYECVHQYITFEDITLDAALKKLTNFIKEEENIPINNGVIEFKLIPDDEVWVISLGWRYKSINFSEIGA